MIITYKWDEDGENFLLKATNWTVPKKLVFFSLIFGVQLKVAVYQKFT